MGPCWGYFWGLTENQVDLMLADQPVVNYKHDKSSKKKGKGKNGIREMSKPADWKVAAAQAAWSKKYGNGGDVKPKLDLGGFSIGGAIKNDKLNGE